MRRMTVLFIFKLASLELVLWSEMRCFAEVWHHRKRSKHGSHGTLNNRQESALLQGGRFLRSRWRFLRYSSFKLNALLFRGGLFSV